MHAYRPKTYIADDQVEISVQHCGRPSDVSSGEKLLNRLADERRHLVRFVCGTRPGGVVEHDQPGERDAGAELDQFVGAERARVAERLAKRKLLQPPQGQLVRLAPSAVWYAAVLLKRVPLAQRVDERRQQCRGGARVYVGVRVANEAGALKVERRAE